MIKVFIYSTNTFYTLSTWEYAVYTEARTAEAKRFLVGAPCAHWKRVLLLAVILELHLNFSLALKSSTVEYVLSCNQVGPFAVF